MANIETSVKGLPATGEEALTKLKNYIQDIKDHPDAYYDEDIIFLKETDKDYFFNWEDGGGNELKVIILKAGGYVVFGYDHEDDNNFYTEEDEKTLQMSLFKGMPEEFQPYITDERLFWSFEANQKYVYASVAVWVTSSGEVGYNKKSYEETDGGLNYVGEPLIEGFDPDNY